MSMMEIDDMSNTVVLQDVQEEINLQKLSETDFYTKYKLLEKQLELLEIQEDYIKE